MSDHRKNDKLDIDESGIEDSEAALKGKDGDETVEPDDIMSRRAAKEALRRASQGETYLVKSDLEDDDQRDAAPGTREQP